MRAIYRFVSENEYFKKYYASLSEQNRKEVERKLLHDCDLGWIKKRIKLFYSEDSTYQELRELASVLSIKNYSRMNKKQLEKAIGNARKQGALPKHISFDGANS